MSLPLEKPFWFILLYYTIFVFVKYQNQEISTSEIQTLSYIVGNFLILKVLLKYSSPFLIIRL